MVRKQATMRTVAGTVAGCHRSLLHSSTSRLQRHPAPQHTGRGMLLLYTYTDSARMLSKCAVWQLTHPVCYAQSQEDSARSDCHMVERWQDALERQ